MWRWRRLDECDPVLGLKLLNERLPVLVFLEMFKLAAQLQLASTAKPSQLCNRPRSVGLAKCSRTDQVKSIGVLGIWRRCRLLPTCTIETGPFAGHQQVNVPVSFQLLIPGVQHRHRSGVVTLFCFDLSRETLPSRTDQQIRHRLSVRQRQFRQFAWQREHDLIVSHAGQDQLGRLGVEVDSLAAATSRTVAIAA